MLQITIPKGTLFNDATSEFIDVKEQTLQLEHSLVSLSKWESTWCKPFLTKTDKTIAESIDYIRCMTLTQNVDPQVYNMITNDIVRIVAAYIDAPMTATTFGLSEKKATNREIITAEIIYYWMISLQVPMECQKWHLNRLLTLINVCSLKNQPPKKMSKQEIAKRNRAINASRKLNLNTRG